MSDQKVGLSKRVFKDGVSILEASQFGHTTGTFEATAATVVFNLISANGTRVVDGDGTKTKSWVQIRELPNHEETTDFT
jgi:hypothetical protein